jgi:hypothetical protein
MKIIMTTTSVKTRLTMVEMLGPRMTDPRAKIDDFLALFRYAEEKAKVEDILKTRSTHLNSLAFTTPQSRQSFSLTRGSPGSRNSLSVRGSVSIAASRSTSIIPRVGGRKTMETSNSASESAKSNVANVTDVDYTMSNNKSSNIKPPSRNNSSINLISSTNNISNNTISSFVAPINSPVLSPTIKEKRKSFWEDEGAAAIVKLDLTKKKSFTVNNDNLWDDFTGATIHTSNDPDVLNRLSNNLSQRLSQKISTQTMQPVSQQTSQLSPQIINAITTLRLYTTNSQCTDVASFIGVYCFC